MPSTSISQQQAAGAALAAKRGEKPKGGLYGASKQMAKMSTDELEKFASTKHGGLPDKKACMKLEDIGREIMNQILDDDEGPGGEQAEVQMATNILRSVARLQSSLRDLTPEVQREVTSIRAAANNLVRMHQQG